MVLIFACGRLWYVCEVALVPYVDAVVAMTVMRALLFVLYVCKMRVRGRNGDKNASVGAGRGVLR